jgi:YVTN family beta-propeller protein/autotransporter-associated beta strand protein
MGTITVGSDPFGVAVSPDGSRAYVTTDGSSAVSVIDTATNTVAATIGVGNTPLGVAVSPDGSRAYVANEFSNTVSVINTTTNTVMGTITVGSDPIGVTVSPDGSRAYVVDANSNSVSVIDTATNTVAATITVGNGPDGVAVSPDGSRAYVTNKNSSTVSVIDTATDTVIATLGVGSVPDFPGICGNGNTLLAGGLTFKANTSGALACTLASGPSGAAGPIFTGGTLQFAGANTSSALPIVLMAAGGIFDTAGNNATLSGSITGPGGLTKVGLGMLTLSGAGTYSGPTAVNAGTLQGGAANAFSPNSAYTIASGAFLDLNSFSQTIGSLSGVGSVTLGAATLTTGNDGTSTTFSGGISGTGGLTKIGGGTLVLSGTNSYAGATAVDAGTLEIDGSIATSSLTSVNSTGILDGTGTVGNTSVSGGVFAPGSGTPGSSQTVSGTLGFSSGGVYRVFLNPTTASSSTVTGTATLTGGTVNAQFASGAYLTHDYEILAATALSGTFNPAVTGTPPTGFAASLDYSHADDVYLDLTATLGALGTGGLSGNQQNVANALNNFFNNGGALPPNFVTIFGLSGAQLSQALSQLDGEASTGAATGTFQVINDFFNLLSDIALGTGGDTGGGGGNAPGFAAEDNSSLPPDVALAYARALKKPQQAAPQQNFDQRWTAWGSGFGGAATYDGNATVGSNTLSASDYGFAGGMDYRAAPDLKLGFALAGAGTNWSLAQSLGSGRSDSFQAAGYGIEHFGALYLTGIAGIGNSWFTTNRTAALGDQLQAKFDGQTYALRGEAGYRYAVLPMAGVTPYAAVQSQWLQLPGYSETDLSGGGFALSYASQTANDTRSELGARFDDLTTFNGMPLVLRARLAWAHDWVSNPAASAAFQALPGTAFTVNGAAVPANSALTTAAAEWHLTANWTAVAKFDGEFGASAQTYAGTGTLKYTW